MSTSVGGERTYNDAVHALNNLQTNFAAIDAIRKAGVKANDLAIPQMVEWIRRAGYQPSDFDKLNIIHVTGTKGKGSTCAFVQSILKQYQPDIIGDIGLYTSPHLKSVRERIRINGEPISKDKFAKYFFEVFDALDNSKSDTEKFPDMTEGVKPNYFRYLTLLSFHVFLKEGIRTAIYEVGIGGEYDSTNVIQAPTATGVTSLGIDHTLILGNTIEEIAWNKGGIFKKSAKALTIPQPESALKVLREKAEAKHTKLEVLERHPQLAHITLGLPAKFQELNATLAISLAQEHLNKLGANIPTINPLPEKFVKGLETATWPGRCQTLLDGKVSWYLDGAHTQESIKEAGIWFSGKVSSTSKHKVLLFNQQTRDASALVTTLSNALGNVEFDHVIFCTNVTWSSGTYSAELTSLNTSKDDVDHLVVQKSLSEAWAKIDPRSERHVFSNIQDSVEFIRKLDGDSQVLVTGSLHLVGGFLAVYEGED